jgi:hypothetical protein
MIAVLQRFVTRIQDHSTHPWHWRDEPVRGYWCTPCGEVLLPLHPDMPGNPADFGPAEIGPSAPIPPELVIDLVLALPDRARNEFATTLERLGL